MMGKTRDGDLISFMSQREPSGGSMEDGVKGKET